MLEITAPGVSGELCTRGYSVMHGYWDDAAKTAEAVDAEGWMHTGDQGRIENGHVFIVGRLKEIIVLSTGEKITPEVVEMALIEDPLIDQAMVPIEGALNRTESRGAHAHRDYPNRDDEVWMKHTLWHSADNSLTYKPVNLKPLTVESVPPKVRTF